MTDAIVGTVALDLERYFYALRPEPGDAFIAGGLLDQYLGVTLGIGFAL